MIIVAIVLLVALLIVCTRPSLQSDDHSDSAQSTFSPR
jgi:FHS family L-fucose permease-like MFS transporter